MKLIAIKRIVKTISFLALFNLISFSASAQQVGQAQVLCANLTNTDKEEEAARVEALLGNIKVKPAQTGSSESVR